MAVRLTMAKPINLALQGGGSHGALTWGVIDRLLEEERLDIVEVSGTSAGAMNAVVLADGYRRGGRAGARAALGAFWKAVSDAARFSPARRTFWDRMSGRYSLDRSPGYLMLEAMGRFFSPYELNPFDLNPLRDLLLAQVDFGNVNASEVRVHVTATNVRTGLPRVFSSGEVTAEAVLASACLPQMYKAVEIGGEAYWDGGFSANPALFPLVANAASPDILIVQINPFTRPELPRTARDIINRVNEISFNTSLVKELRTLALAKRVGARLAGEDGSRMAIPQLFLHMIHVDEEVQDLAASSKLNAEWSYLRLLFDRGRRWAGFWLRDNLDKVGAASTFDVEELFREASHRPKELPPPLTDG